MNKRIQLDDKTLSDIRKNLETKLNQLTSSREQHNQSVGQTIPPDSEEASSLIEEIEINQTENRMESKEAEQIVAALKRMNDGVFGICTSCDKAIGTERLMAIPSAQLCIQCQSDKENT